MTAARGLAAIAALLATAFCQAQERTLTVLGAASLRETLEQVANGYKAAHPGWQVRLTFSGSQQLAAQIALGAPADVFASADLRNMMKAVDSGRIAKRQVVPFAANKLVLVVARSSSQRIADLGDLANPGVRLIVGAPQVPVGGYTLAMLLKASRSFDRAWLGRVQANIVSKELDVRSVLAKVVLGEADAGIVYTSDAETARGKVVAHVIPDRWNERALYYVAPVLGSRAAADFIRLLTGDLGKRALRQHGLSVPQR